MQKLKQSRLASFIIITLVYIISAAVGIVVYNFLEFPWWVSLLIADTAATVVTFIFSLIFGNAILFFAVSIPMADGRQSKKEGFAEYKRATRMLLPIRIKL